MKNYSLDRLIKINIALSAEKDIHNLLELILKEAMEITNCDGGTMYVKEKEYLHFNNMITKSKNFDKNNRNGDIGVPPVPLNRQHVCAVSALDHKRINIPDVYESKEYDFSGAQNYDRLNGYRTGSMLVIPMEDDKYNVIGVMQLINALDDDGKFIPFEEADEELIYALSSFAAISINNRRLAQNVNDILHSFVEVMVEAVDIRTPYNANHTRSMARYGRQFVEWLDTVDVGWRFTEEKKDPFIMSIWLHDIGKLQIPGRVMNKPTRLGQLKTEVFHRIEVAILMERLRALEKPDEEDEANRRIAMLKEAREDIEKADDAGFLSDELVMKLDTYKALTVTDSEGKDTKLLNEEEYTAISVRKGTLTEAERRIMEQHVSYTSQMLSKMKFDGDYEEVPLWAGAHHEFINGTGYPKQLSGDELSKEMRLLTILDIYDALTAEDRPYKPPMSPEKAFDVLKSMRDEGKLDGEILELFIRSNAWERRENPRGENDEIWTKERRSLL
ncbi:MAG: GAF domain-containing protein [Lachnospiraceae bacterium]|nr:GAF domain-containing protein [Lachnospiraceae bacterium]